MNVDKVTSAAKDMFSSKKEGPVAKAIEKQTAKLPSDTFLWAAVASIGASLVFQVMGNQDRVMDHGNKLRERSLFIGQWAPTFLILGLYNKIVKQLGSDRREALRAA